MSGDFGVSSRKDKKKFVQQGNAGFDV